MLKIKTFGDTNKTSKLHFQRNEEQIKLGNFCYHSDPLSNTLPCISKHKVKFENNIIFRI
jgi:hypothetical protein